VVIGATTILYLLGLAYFLIQTVSRLIYKQWPVALWSALALILCTSLCVPLVLQILFVMSWFAPDNFANDLTIPTNIEVMDPLPEPSTRQNSDHLIHEAMQEVLWAGRVPDPCISRSFESTLRSLAAKSRPEDPNDTFQKALCEAWRTPPTSDPCVVPSLPSLRVLASERRSLLMRYLASSPAWQVSGPNNVVATRRWRLGRRWWAKNGWFASRDILPYTGGGMAASFQTRTTIALHNKPWSEGPNLTVLDEGTTAHPVLMDRRWAFDSTVVIRCGDIAVGLSEESAGPERRLTKAAIHALEVEFEAVLNKRDFDRSLLPVDSVRRGKPVFNLYNGLQGGIYDTEIWINPGEPGLVYLKAFEVTRNTRLSAERLRGASSERVGWSDDPNELFYSNSNIMIYEGDWGHPYAARFELWFVPDSGQPERMLLEGIYKIEGWEL